MFPLRHGNSRREEAGRLQAEALRCVPLKRFGQDLDWAYQGDLQEEPLGARLAALGAKALLSLSKLRGNGLIHVTRNPLYWHLPLFQDWAMLGHAVGGQLHPPRANAPYVDRWRTGSVSQQDLGGLGQSGGAFDGIPGGEIQWNVQQGRARSWVRLDVGQTRALEESTVCLYKEPSIIPCLTNAWPCLRTGFVSLERLSSGLNPRVEVTSEVRCNRWTNTS